MSMLTPITLEDISVNAKIVDFDNLSTVVSDMSESISEMERNIVSNRTYIDETKTRLDELSGDVIDNKTSIESIQYNINECSS
jgi:uncharacterized coiled-coil DUF342 family protein